MTRVGNYDVVTFLIYYAPKCPTDKAIYFGSTPILEQALGVVDGMAERGYEMLIKGRCSDGVDRWYV